jgi:hypothetical protein
MGTPFSRSLFGIVAAAGILAACHSSENYAPPTPAPASLPMVAHEANVPGSPRNMHLPDCKVSVAKLPGTAIIMDSEGDVKNGTYSTIDGSWVEGKVTPTAAPSASPASEPSPPVESVYVYVGTYRLKKTRQIGCAYLVTSLEGKPLVGNDNATLTAAPDFSSDSFAFKRTNQGRLIAMVSGLSASGGSGTLTLKTASGGTYDTGTLALTTRITKHENVLGGAIPSNIGNKSPRIRPNYAFSCNPNDYQYSTVVDVTAGTETRLPTPYSFIYSAPVGANDLYWYRPHYSFCGVDNSNVDSSVVTNQKQGSNGAGNPTMLLRANFDANYRWGDHPYVAVWEEAWFLNFIPDGRYNINAVLVHVR